jgi:hypothetical protein
MPTETYEISQTLCGDEDLRCCSVFEWFKCFKGGREDLRDDPRIGRPSISRNVVTIANVRKMVT